MKNGIKTLSLLLVLVIVSLSGCVNNKNSDIVSPTPTVTGAPEEPIVTDNPEDENPEEGITYEEELAINPPPPRNLSGVFNTDNIELTWDVPETVTLPHNYSDKIDHYDIYKTIYKIDEEGVTYTISTPGLTFKDSNVSTGSTYIYEVVAVHEDDVYSVPSEEVAVET